MRYRRFVLAAAAALLFSSQPARAQLPPLNLPAGGAYKPIPNFTGDSAGLQFRSAINDRLSGVVPVSPKVVSVPFASLGAEQDGAVVYCSDCQATAACANGGAGTWAFGSNGRWTCAPPASTAIPVVNASTFSGADMSAKIDAAVASPQCSAGCIVDDGVVAGSLQALSGPIVINRNFVTVRINGRYTYAAAAIAGGPIQVAAGTLGGGVECPLTPQWYDVANGVFPGAGGIDYEPSSGSGPIASIGNQAESVTFRGCVFYGNQNVTDGIDVNGTSPNAVQFIDNTFVGAGGTAGSPTGTAITTTNTGGGGAYDRVRVRHNRIIRWASGIHWFANTGGAAGNRHHAELFFEPKRNRNLFV